MRKYDIYLIEEEVASYYFGRESIVYNLFLDSERTTHEKKRLLNKQIDFITRPIPVLEIRKMIESTLNSSPTYYQYRDSFFFTVDEPKSEARMVVKNQMIHLESVGSYEAETVFFEILRKYDSCFLAMDYDHNRYGWLNPIKQRKFV